MISFGPAPDQELGPAHHTTTTPPTPTPLVSGFFPSGRLVTPVVLRKGVAAEHTTAGVNMAEIAALGWTAGPALPARRSGATSARLPDGKTIVMGGWDGNQVGRHLATTVIFDPATNLWTPGPSMARARYYACATELADGRIIIIGGESGNVCRNGEWTDEETALQWDLEDAEDEAWNNYAEHYKHELETNGDAGIPIKRILATRDRTSEIFYPAAMVWTTGPALTSKRSHSACALLPDGKVIAMGGEEAESSTEVLDPTTLLSTVGPGMPSGRHSHSSVALSDSKIILIGGASGAYPDWVCLSTTSILDLTTMQWAPGPAMATPRQYAAAVALADGRIMVIGGCSPTVSGKGLVRLSSTTLLDSTAAAAAMKWSAGSALTAARHSLTAAVLSNGKIAVAGGETSVGHTETTEILDTYAPALGHPAHLAGDPAVLAPVPDCADMRPAEIAVHLGTWLTAAEQVKADPEQAKETHAATIRIRSNHGTAVAAAQSRKDQSVLAARALRDRKIAAARTLRDRIVADARQEFNGASTTATKTLRAERAVAGTTRDQHLEQFRARADAELAKLLPEIEKVRGEKEDMAKAAASFKRRSDSGAASAGKRARNDDPPCAECGICLERPKNMVFQCGHCACATCSEKLKDCHVCRTKITSKHKLFF